MRDFICNMFMMFALIFLANAGYILITGDDPLRWLVVVGNVLLAGFNGVIYRIASKDK